jgi:hypothetical protein
MIDSTLTPEEELAALEQAAMDGDAVTPAQMAEAREKIGIFKLVAKGVAMRAEQKRKKDALALQAKTKVDVGLVFTAGEYVDPLVAYDKAVAALNYLADTIERNAEILVEASDDLRRGGVLVYSNWAAMPDGIDRANFSTVGQGNEVMNVTLAGVAYTREDAGLWVRAVVQTVAADHRGLQIPYSSDLEQVVRGNRPDALKNRAA